MTTDHGGTVSTTTTDVAFDVAFQPIVSVMRDEAGALTVSIDWADSLLGEWNPDSSSHDDTEAAEIAAAFMDAVVKANGLGSIPFDTTVIAVQLRAEAENVRARIAGLATDAEQGSVDSLLRRAYDAELGHIEAALAIVLGDE